MLGSSSLSVPVQGTSTPTWPRPSPLGPTSLCYSMCGQQGCMACGQHWIFTHFPPAPWACLSGASRICVLRKWRSGRVVSPGGGGRAAGRTERRVGRVGFRDRRQRCQGTRRGLGWGLGPQEGFPRPWAGFLCPYLDLVLGGVTSLPVHRLTSPCSAHPALCSFHHLPPHPIPASVSPAVWLLPHLIPNTIWAETLGLCFLFS